MKLRNRHQTTRRRGGSGDNTTKRSSYPIAVAAVVVLFLVFLWRHDRSNEFDEPSSLLSSIMTTAAMKKTSRQRQQHQQPKDAAHLLKQSLPETRYKIHNHLEGIDMIEPSNTTIVTSHFVVDANPYTDTYYAYISHFLTVQDSMVIFTCSKMVNRMKLLRSLWPARTVIVEVLDLHDLPVSKLGNSDGSFWENQLNMDPYKNEHVSYEFYWMWLSKSWFVNEAIRFNFFDSQFFVYSDIELFRTKKYLNKRIVQKPNVVPYQSLLWVANTIPNPPANPISDFGLNDNNNDDDDTNDYHLYHVGNMGAGKIDAWQAFHDEFASTLDKFVQAEQFVGNDDRILQSTCQIHPKLCNYVLAKDVSEDDPAVRACLRTVLHKGIGGKGSGGGKKKKKKKHKLYRGKLGYKNAGQGGRKLPKKKITG